MGTVSFAQVTSGTILGTVTDASNAAIAKAKVRITNTGTNIGSDVVTNDQGNFELPYLQDGQYSVSVEAPGFKSFVQTGITLSTDQKYRVDVKLEVGASSQSVQVVANVQTLQTDSSELSDTVDRRTIENMPNINGNPLLYAMLEAGMTPTGSFLDPNNVNTGDNSRSNYTSFVVNGAQPSSTNIQLDGSSNTSPYGNEIAVLPSREAIGEVRVITNAYSAEYGRAGGGVISFTTKSGTNQYHGTLYENFRNSYLNANNFGNNTFGDGANGKPLRPKAPFNTNQFGGSFAGPVIIPKLYNGKDKTFFFMSYEGLRRVQGQSTYYTVPTALEREGNFSQTKSSVTVGGIATAEPVNIYLPLPATTTETLVSAGNYQLNRQQATYNGTANVIPPSLLNPTALKLANMMPLPNIPAVNVDGSSNYFSNAPTYTRTDQWIVKLDHTFDENKKGFFRWTTDWTLSNPPNVFAGTTPAANSNGPTTQFNPSVALGYTWTISPTQMLELRANLTRINLILVPIGGLDYNLQGLGFSPTELQGLPTTAFPLITMGTAEPSAATGIPQEGLGNFVLRNNHTDIFSITPNYTKIAKNWTIKIGGEYQSILYNFTQPYKASINFNTLGAAYTQPCSGTGCPGVAATTVNGSALATFLLGGADGGAGNGEYATGDPTEALKNGVWSLYSQNDWKATRKLTLNLGLRWELQGPLTDRYNRLSQFNLNGINETGTAGLYEFSGVGGDPRGQTNSDWKNFAPRVGFAYRLNDKTVIRSAYGISYIMITGVGSGAQGFGSDGFSAPSYDQITPTSGPYANQAIIAQPFTNAYTSGGITANTNPLSPVLLGQSVTAIIRDDSRIPYMQQWNFTVQRELPWHTNLQVAYVGTKGTFLAIQQKPVNQTDDIPQATLNSAISTYVATGTNPLTTLVPNPFYGIISNNTNLRNPTIQQMYLDEPYPAYGSVTRFQDRIGSSNYNALQVTLKRAFDHGFQIMGAYTWSKAIDFGGAYVAQVQTGTVQGSVYWDPNNMALDRSVSAFDQTQRLVLSYVWELPFGKGKEFLGHTPVVSQVVGGWKVAGISTFASGFPMPITGGGFGRPNVIANPVLPKADQIIGNGKTAVTVPTGQSIVVPAGYQMIFNPDAFSVPVLTVPKAGSPGQTVNVANPYFYGDAPRLWDTLRGPGINNFDLSLSRTFSIRERLKLDARLDAFNAFNRVQPGIPSYGFGGPNLTTPGQIGMNTSSTFGMLNTTTEQTAVGGNTNISRYLQVSLRLYF